MSARVDPATWQWLGMLAQIIWNTSHADEGTISAAGANKIAAALMAAGWCPPEHVDALIKAGWTVGVADGKLSNHLRMEPTNPYDGTIHGGPDAAETARVFTTEYMP